MRMINHLHVWVWGPYGKEMCSNCHAPRAGAEPECQDGRLRHRVDELANSLVGFARLETLGELGRAEPEVAEAYREDAREILMNYPHLLPLDLREYMEAHSA